MRTFFTGLIIFIAAVGLALVARFNPGNVVVFFPPYRIDLSLNLFVVLAVIGFFVFYGLLRVVRNTMRLPQRVAHYRQRQLQQRAYQALRNALRFYFEGRFGHAEKQARLAQNLPETAGLAALIAARATHRITEYQRRDNWLIIASSIPGIESAKLMIELECAVDAHDTPRALAVVEQLQSLGTRHIQVLRLALKSYQHAEKWPEVLRTLRILNKRQAIHPIAFRQIKILAYQALIAQRKDDAPALLNFWQTLANDDRRIPEIALAMATALNGIPDDPKNTDDEHGQEARHILEIALAYQWDKRLLQEYVNCPVRDHRPQIEWVEAWLRDSPNDENLHYVLGVLCAHEQLWGKAQHHLHSVLSSNADAALKVAAHCALGQVFEKIDNPEQAAFHFRSAALGKK